MKRKGRTRKLNLSFFRKGKNDVEREKIAYFGSGFLYMMIMKIFSDMLSEKEW